MQRLLISLDSRFQLTDILGTTFPKGRLGLTITLFPFLRGGVDLRNMTGLIMDEIRKGTELMHGPEQVKDKKQTIAKSDQKPKINKR